MKNILLDDVSGKLSEPVVTVHTDGYVVDEKLLNAPHFAALVYAISESDVYVDINISWDGKVRVENDDFTIDYKISGMNISLCTPLHPAH